MKTVLVLAGGPDWEREVSLKSAGAVAAAIEKAGAYRVHHAVVDQVTAQELARLPGDVVWPVLHGRWGEGGGMQALLETDGRPFVGCGFRAARTCIDKVLTKSLAAEVGLLTTSTCILDPADSGLALELPVVVKPVFEGSTLGLYVCRTEAEWLAAHRASAASGRSCMVEPFIKGREITAGLIGEPGDEDASDLRALPLIEIVPAEGLYDYEAKYTRNDTKYRVAPDLGRGVGEAIKDQTRRIAERAGVRHLCRADFILDDQGRAWFLEVNTMPGFTDHSLVPMAAAHEGLDMPRLCTHLVSLALSDHDRRHGVASMELQGAKRLGK